MEQNNFLDAKQRSCVIWVNFSVWYSDMWALWWLHCMDLWLLICNGMEAQRTRFQENDAKLWQTCLVLLTLSIVLVHCVNLPRGFVQIDARRRHLFVILRTLSCVSIVGYVFASILVTLISSEYACYAWSFLLWLLSSASSKPLKLLKSQGHAKGVVPLVCFFSMCLLRLFLYGVWYWQRLQSNLTPLCFASLWDFM